MAFTRHLSPEFVNQLNRLYETPGSWWQMLVESDDVFLAIRNDSINAYAKGMSIGKIGWDGRNVTLIVHEEYLSLSSNVQYLNLLAPGTQNTRPVAYDEKGYIAHLGSIKNRAGRFAGGERKGTNKIACRVLTVVDMEAAFTETAEKEPDPEKRREVESDSGRLDLVVLAADKRLLTFEAKLFSNGELRSETTPKVCGQLSTYHSTIAARHRELVEAYANVVGTFASLRGHFFENRVRHPNWAAALKDPGSITIDPIPRLLIFDYDGLQESSNKATVARIQEHAGIPGFDLKHIKTIGNASSVRETHLV
jgi:hypothetical protein